MRLEPAASSFRIEAYDAAPLDLAVSSRVDQVWGRQKRVRGSSLYDAPLLALESCDPERLVGHWTTYRAYVAMRSEPEFVGLDEIVPVGVSGLVVSDDCVLFGRRSSCLTSYPGFIELLPSGSIDTTFYDPNTRRVNYLRQLLRELEEEVGLAPSTVLSSGTLGIVRDRRDPCCDVVVRLDVSLGTEDLERLGSQPGDGEYCEIYPVRIRELPEFVEHWSQEVIPTSLAALEFVGWLGGRRIED